MNGDSIFLLTCSAIAVERLKRVAGALLPGRFALVLIAVCFVVIITRPAFALKPDSRVAGPASALSYSMKDTLVELPQVVVRAARIFQKETAGMKQSHVDSLVINHKSHLSLSDLLSENTPVFIRNHGRGALATASFRGTAPSHTQVNWNGIRINSPMAGMVDFSLIPVYIIDEVELKHGTASVAGGSGGLGGAVNIGNKVNWNNGKGLKYMQGVGSYGTFDEFLDMTAGNRKLQSRTRLYHNQSKNDYTFVNNNIADIDPVSGQITHPVDTNRHAAYTRYGFLQEVYLRPGNKNAVSVKWWSQWANRSIPRTTSYEGPDNSNINRQADTDHRVVADWSHYTAHGRWIVRTGFTWKQLDYTLKNNVPGLGFVPAIFSESTQRGFLNHLGYSRSFSRNFSLEAALDANSQHVVSSESVMQTGYDRQRTELSAMLALRKSFFDRLNLNLMVRQERVGRTFTPLIPYAGFDVRLVKNATLILKGSVSGNYRMPTLDDLYWQPGGNPELAPEEGFSYETGLEYQAVLAGQSVEAGVTFYRADIDNWIIWIPGFKAYWEPRNIRRVKAQGLEASLRIKGFAGPVSYGLLAGYALNSSKNYGDVIVWGDESYGKQLVYVPLHSGNLMLSIAHKGYQVMWQHNAYSERFTTSSNDVSQRNRLYPYYMNDVSLGKDLAIKTVSVAIGLKVYNVFNESYRNVLYRPMPGRNFMLSLTLKV